MNRILRVFWMGSLAVSLLAGSTLLVRADDDKPMMGDEAGGPGRIEKMKEKLGLSDGQVSKLKDLFKKQREDMKPLRDQMRIDMDMLQQKVDMKASDNEIRQLLDKLDAERKEMESRREKMKGQLRVILTPTQQAKFVLGMRAKGMEMMGKRMKHHKGGMKKGGDGQSNSPASDQDSNAGK